MQGDFADDQPLPFDTRLSQPLANGRSGPVRSEGDVLGKNFGRGGENGFLVRFSNRLKRRQSPAQPLGKKFRNITLPLNGREGEREDNKKSHGERICFSVFTINPHFQLQVGARACGHCVCPGTNDR